MTDNIEQWLDQGRECLNRLLESGAADQGAQAMEALDDWIHRCGDAGWPEITRLGRTLLDESSIADDKADALPRMLIWYESICHEYDLVLLKKKYGLGRER